MIRRGFAVALLAGALVAAACGARRATTAAPRHAHPRPAAPGPSPPPKEFVEAMNRFGRETWAKMRVNIASPMALALAVSILDSGARGSTRSAIAKALHLPAGEDPARWWRQWLAWTAPDRIGPHPALHLRTRLWVQQGFPVEPDFQRVLDESYAADWTPVDFARYPMDEQQRLVRWLKRGTSGGFNESRLRTYVEHSLLVSTTLGFSACWQHPFDPAKTVPARFSGNLGDLQLPMMHGTVRGYYAKTDSAQMARIPLASSGNARWELFIFSRYDHAVEPVLRSGVAAMAGKLQPAVLDLTLPKFGLEPEVEELYAPPSGPLHPAFGKRPDLSGIAGGVRLDEIVWAGGTRMDEAGIGQPGPCSRASRQAPKRTEKLSRVVFKVDRGFLFAVRDAVSGVVVLMGTNAAWKHLPVLL